MDIWRACFSPQTKPLVFRSIQPKFGAANTYGFRRWEEYGPRVLQSSKLCATRHSQRGHFLMQGSSPWFLQSYNRTYLVWDSLILAIIHFYEQTQLLHVDQFACSVGGA